MKVSLGDGYYLNGDQFCYWVTRHRKGGTKKNGEKAQDRDERVSGYLPTIGECFQDFANKVRGGEDVTSFKKFVDEEKKTRELIKGWCENDKVLCKR